MIVYNYTAHLSPPAPFVSVALTCPATGVRIANQPAQMDTGADRTVLPANLVEALGLVEDGRLFFQGFTGSVAELPLFLVDVSVHDLPPVSIRAVLGEAEPHILLGRDVLNAHHILLDGPDLKLGIG